jgi:hypothetical protein
LGELAKDIGAQPVGGGKPRRAGIDREAFAQRVRERVQQRQHPRSLHAKAFEVVAKRLVEVRWQATLPAALVRVDRLAFAGKDLSGQLRHEEIAACALGHCVCHRLCCGLVVRAAPRQPRRGFSCGSTLGS